MNILTDTCVIIDALQQREPFAREAQQLCLAVAEGKITGFIAASSVTDIYYIMHRAFHSDQKTREALKKLLMSFGILDTTALDCRNAVTSPISDFEDAVLAETAYRTGVDCIVTRNTKDFARSIVTVKTPSEILKQIGGQSK